MKKIVLLLLLVCFVSVSFADTGWFDDNITLSVNGSSNTYYLVGSGTEFDGSNLGSVSTLTFTACDMKYWSDTQDRGGGAFYWELKTTGGSSVSGPYEIIWSQTGPSGNDYQGTWSGSDNVFKDLGPSDDNNTYELHVWAKSWDSGGGQGDSWLSNGGSNYVATLTIPEGALPITLVSFTAEALNGTVELNWTTETETENSHFLVYRDGEVIASVEGNGTTTEQHSYTYLDTRVQGGVHSYAIADVTYGGVEELHDAVVVEVGVEIAEADFVLNKAYPNPFNPTTVISMHYAVGSDTELNIYNTQGVLVDQLVNGFVEAGKYDITWDATNMPSGVYIVNMVAGNVMQSQKIVLMK